MTCCLSSSCGAASPVSNPVDLANFKAYRNKLKNVIGVAKRQYYEDIFARNKSNSSLLWKHPSNIVNPSSFTRTPDKLSLQGTEVEGVALANAFNESFLSCNHSKYDLRAVDYVRVDNCSSALLATVTSSEVVTVFWSTLDVL